MSDFESTLSLTSENSAAAEEGCVSLLETLDEQAQDLIDIIEAHPFSKNAKAYAEQLPTSPAASEMGQSGTFIGNAKTVIMGAQRRAKAALTAHAERQASEEAADLEEGAPVGEEAEDPLVET